MDIKKIRQCAKCPWKKSTKPYSIPDGYSVEKHKVCTIAEPSRFTLSGQFLVMSCHEHSNEEGVACVGWLANQLGPGNNIALRLAVIGKRFSLRLDGPQHERFEDTLPGGRVLQNERNL